MPVGRVGCRRRLCNCLTVWSIWIACESFTACILGRFLRQLVGFREPAPMKFKIDDFVYDILIEMGHSSMCLVPDALRSGFQEIYRIEPSPARHSDVYNAVRIELERQPSATRIMLYGGSAVAALNQACENSQNKSVTVHLINKEPDCDLGSSADIHHGLVDEIQVVRRWFSDNIFHPIVIVSGVGGDRGRLLVSEVIDALLDICPLYYFQMLDDDLRRNVLVAVPPAWVYAWAAGGAASISGGQTATAHSSQD